LCVVLLASGAVAGRVAAQASGADPGDPQDAEVWEEAPRGDADEPPSYPEARRRTQKTAPGRWSLYDDRLRLRLTTLAKGIFFDDFASAPGADDEEVEALTRLRLRADFVLSDLIDGRLDSRINLRWSQDELRDRDLEVDGELTEAWLRARRPIGSGEGFLQIGRSRLREERGWWWDEEFESVRVGYESPLWRSQLGVGERLTQDEIDDDGRRDLRDELTWLFGELSHQWFFENFIEARWLTQIDRDRGPRTGASTSQLAADEDVTWIGVSARGRAPAQWLGLPVRYWLDFAWVGGEEVRLRRAAGSSQVVRDPRHVDGTGLDLGATIETSLPATPAFTFAYAYGSSLYRQPSLKRNRSALSGTPRFRFYGELLRPQLANLHVVTAGVGFALGPHLWLETLGHQYWQDRTRSELRDDPFVQSPDGKNRDLGRGVDVVLGLRPDGPWIFDVAYGVFWAGAAYDAQGRDAHRVNLRFGRHWP
jgi:hypothetical protein